VTARILPPSIAPWQDCLSRRHAPPPQTGRYGYQSFRQCLRWEFGFTCAFCLCHESDLALYGVEGTGLTGVEHFVPCTTDTARVNDYTNCFYACRFCNLDRATRANVDHVSGSRLLDPCEAVWAQHFERVRDELTPRDQAARYTHKTYNLDHPRKVSMRRFRRETLEAYLAVLQEGPRLHEGLITRAIETADSTLISEAEKLAAYIRQAYDFLTHYSMLPQDRQCPCLCGDEALCTIPEMLRAQALALELPAL
jgi:hypothetical protein